MDFDIKPNPVVDTPQGKLKGFVLQSRKGKEYYGFYGIPYAKKPERFQPPERWEKWPGILDATKAKDRCVQVSMITKKVFGSEDCLFLNIFTPHLPSSDKFHHAHKTHPNKVPVMVFIFGGGFSVGGGDLYGGKYLVDEDIILVTFNYRLGALGFLNTGDGNVSGNMGLKDQLMCLKWVRENIQYFGGDKDQVTLVGESAGSACVHFHMMSSQSKGLFKRAIMQSGTAISPWAFSKNPADKVKKLVKQLGLGCSTDDTAEMVLALKAVDAGAIAAQHMDFDVWSALPLIHFAPSLDSGEINADTFLHDSPINILHSGKLMNEVPLILGVNGQEGIYKSVRFYVDLKALIHNPAKMKALNDDWVHEAPTYLLYNKHSVDHHEEFAKTVRKFYFGTKPFCSETRDRITDLISDRYFIHSTKTTALLHGSFHKTENPIYLYIFDYDGEYSYLNSYEVFETFGAGHADELQYLMNQRIFYSRIAKGSEDDMMIEKMTSMWANFIKTGIPRHPGSDFSWDPLPLHESPKPRPLKWYQIAEMDSMIDEPFKSRMAFWESLPYHLF